MVVDFHAANRIKLKYVNNTPRQTRGRHDYIIQTKIRVSSIWYRTTSVHSLQGASKQPMLMSFF